MHRAYSILNVKSVDQDRRVITGVATTPEPDRMGDIVEPLGITYKNPLPLLLYHDSRKPVGSVKFKTPTKAGIEFEARLPIIDEPGTLKDRVDEAWQSIKTGLIAGVSIGFRALEEAFMQETSSFRFLKTEVLELSLVAIPANPDATIQTIKSLDIGLAAPGRETDGDPVKQPGAAGTVRVVKTIRPDKQHMAKTILEQISSFEATRQAKAARMSEIMTKASDEGVTLDAAQTDEYDGLDVDVKALDAHLTRLAALETANKAAARPAAGSNTDEASRSRGGSVITVQSTLPPGIEFARMVMCKMASFDQMMKGNFVSAYDIAKSRYPDNTRIHNVLKAAVAPALSTPADGAWAGALVEPSNLQSEFIEFLRPKTIIGRIPGLRNVPFNIRVIGQTSGGSGYWVGEGKPKPLTKFDFAPTSLGYTKLANIAVMTQEAARFSTPSLEKLVRDGLAAAIIERMDIDFIDPDKAAVANVSPASITNGVTPITSAGSEASHLRTDLQALFSAFIADNMDLASAVLIMPTATALAISLMRNGLGQREFDGITMNGGTLEGIPVVTSQYVTDGSPGGAIIILVIASEIFLADDGEVMVDVSREASLEMSDTPTQNGAAGTGASLVSLWQNNLIGLRAERFINWARRRTEAVQYLSGVAYSATGSPS